MSNETAARTVSVLLESGWEIEISADDEGKALSARIMPPQKSAPLYAQVEDGSRRIAWESEIRPGAIELIVRIDESDGASLNGDAKAS